MPQLRWLHVGNSNLTDQSLKEISASPQLTPLPLRPNKNVTEAGLPPLPAMPHLTSVRAVRARSGRLWLLTVTLFALWPAPTTVGQEKPRGPNLRDQIQEKFASKVDIRFDQP